MSFLCCCIDSIRYFFFFFKQKTAYEMRISDWSSDVCSSDLLFAHFNIKLWIPHINPTNFDASYWALDQLMRPVVDACMFLRRSAFFFIPYESNFYMISYIALFYTSFLYHAIKKIGRA